jgi:hypothetical protein
MYTSSPCPTASDQATAFISWVYLVCPRPAGKQGQHNCAHMTSICAYLPTHRKCNALRHI